MSNDNVTHLHDKSRINQALVDLFRFYLTKAEQGDVDTGCVLAIQADNTPSYGYFGKAKHFHELDRLSHVMALELLDEID